MTGGSNQGGGNHEAHGVGGPTPALQPRDDRETLSALFDGELPGDATRFALKRLEHDVQWQDTCGRWQMLGDLLRGESTAAAPVHFAEGVVRALGQIPAGQVQAQPVVPARARPAAWGRWAGGAALAASVALAAVLVVKPFSSPSGSQAPPAVAQQVTPSTLPAIATPPPATTGGDDSVIAVAPAPAPVPTRLASSPRPARTITRSRPAAAGAAQPEAPAVTVVAAAPAQPFHPPVDDVVTRPWPRAVLPDSAAAGAFTVGLGGAAPSPSFYPFEPKVTQPPATQDEDVPPP
ncbi:sigma-E factor negative regulatory protein [Agrilutibacter solisilvae]|uniref:Sigma-E factor negative regulatory protein n=1 Tax=Agrilutibacter solisilvae TaxID=2763317 RepID=A0A974Y0L4_9GAMM|nr:sigma-E factor negative regulatory protein [Lysobacter solisilvae]QSX78240.1 sigma-E factor negative regulatory protein [Lysobacter solisilvae]